MIAARPNSRNETALSLPGAQGCTAGRSGCAEILKRLCYTDSNSLMKFCITNLLSPLFPLFKQNMLIKEISELLSAASLSASLASVPILSSLLGFCMVVSECWVSGLQMKGQPAGWQPDLEVGLPGVQPARLSTHWPCCVCLTAAQLSGQRPPLLKFSFSGS